jgi:hypothetical protein
MRRKIPTSAVEATTAPGVFDTLMPDIRSVSNGHTFFSTSFCVNLIIAGAIVADILERSRIMGNQFLINKTGHLKIYTTQQRTNLHGPERTVNCNNAVILALQILDEILSIL